MLQPVQFAQETAETRASFISSQCAQNVYLEANPKGAKSPVTLYGTPGLKSWLTVASGPLRGMHQMAGYLYVISGHELWAINPYKVARLVGEIGGHGHCFIVDNGTHLGIGTTADGYAANRYGVITLPVSNVVGVAYQDGMGVFATAGDAEEFWATDPDDMTTISGTSYSNADAMPDGLKGCVSDARELWLFGRKTIEIWNNTGASPFPFERSPGGVIQRGCLASGSIVQANGQIFWLGDDYGAYASQGYSPQKISPPWIDRLIAASSDAPGARAFTYGQLGHVFYCLCFPDLTLCYDLTTQLWHTRKSYGSERWRCATYARAFGLDLVGDCETGEIFELDPYTYSDAGNPIERVAVAPPISAGGNRACMSRFWLDIDAGVGLATGQGSDPQCMLDWSDDGGKTWGNELTAGFGPIGEYRYRCQWNALGAFSQRALRVRITDPVPVAIAGAWAQIESRE